MHTISKYIRTKRYKSMKLIIKKCVKQKINDLSLDTYLLHRRCRHFFWISQWYMQQKFYNHLHGFQTLWPTTISHRNQTRAISPYIVHCNSEALLSVCIYITLLVRARESSQQPFPTQPTHLQFWSRARVRKGFKWRNAPTKGIRATRACIAWLWNYKRSVLRA